MQTGVPAWDLLLEPLPGLVLVVTRVAGLLIFLPLLSSSLLPVRFKVLISIAMGMTVYPLVDTGVGVPLTMNLYEIAPLALRELTIGVIIGFVTAIPIMTAQHAGSIMGRQMGLGIAQVFNPAIDIQGDNVGQALFFAAMASYLMSGGFDIAYSTLLDTFGRVPIGGFSFDQTPIDLIVGVIASGYDVAIRVALPVIAILIVETLVVGFIMKTIPTLNIMIFGFPIKIIGGLTVTIAAFVIMLETILGELDEVLAALQDWASLI